MLQQDLYGCTFLDLFAGSGAIGIEALITLMAIALAKRSLGGMSGDIAGFGIVFGELAGIFAMLVL